MIMKKSLGVIFLLSSLLILLIACNTESDNNSDNETDSSENDETSEEVTTITYLRPGNQPDQNEELINAINEKLAEDGTNLELEIEYVPSDAWLDKQTMMLSTGEAFDLFPIMEDQKSLTSYVSTGGVMSINDYLDDYGTNIKKVVPEWMWDSATYDGDIYTIPANWTTTADQNNNITLRTELLEKWDLEVPETRDDLLNMAKVFTENWEGDASPVVIPMFSEPFYFLFRTMDTYPFTVLDDLIYIDQEGNVENWMETEEFKISVDFFRELYENDYIPKDILGKPDGWTWDQMVSGDFIWVDEVQLWDSAEVWNERSEGVELDVIYLNPEAPVFRDFSFRNSTAVSATSENPAEAVQFMDWVYASQENYDLMVYGIEGVTWQDEGEGSFTKLIPDFEFNEDWMIGNLE